MFSQEDLEEFFSSRGANCAFYSLGCGASVLGLGYNIGVNGNGFFGANPLIQIPLVIGALATGVGAIANLLYVPNPSSPPTDDSNSQRNRSSDLESS